MAAADPVADLAVDVPDRSAALDRRIILICDEGYQASLAAATLRDLGFARGTDLVGGFRAWRAAGLLVEPVPRP